LAYAAGFAVLSLVLGSTLFVVPYLPTNDGPEHVLASHIENHYGDPGTLYRETLLPASEFAARGFTLLFGPLADGLGWRVGLQVCLAVIVLLTAWGFVALVQAVDRGRVAVAFLGFPLALTWELYMGFFPFTFGSALGLFVLSLAVRWAEPTRLQRFVLAFLLLIQAVCHVFSATLTGIVLALVLVLRLPRARWAGELARTALIGAPAASILLLSVLTGRSLTKSPFSSDFLVLPAAETLLVFPRLLAPGPGWRALAVAALVVAALLVSAARALRSETSRLDRALFIAGASLIVVGALCPMNIPGWQFFSPRFLPLGVLVTLASLPLERASRRAGDALAVVVFGFSLVSLVASVPFHRRLAAAAGDAIIGLSVSVERRGFWLPITLSPEGGMPFDPRVSEVPFLAPLRHISALYAVVEGGLPPYTFANNAATYPFVIRPDGRKAPPIPPAEKYAPEMESDVFDNDVGYRLRVEDELATYGMFYEGVLVTAARPYDLALWHARGFAPDWERGTVLVGHFVPCLLDVTIPASGDPPLLDVGVGGQTIFKDEHPEPKLSQDGSRHLSLPRAPCGAVWVRPHWDRTTSDGSHERRYCPNAEPTGEIRATLTWAAAKVTCGE